ncbi:MAG TPA: DNA-processing protein DprA [Candidatus Paceibacterota bacterium]|nr:DNA-processing protein DprA [Candidatus Paceibacterota bacterium]
MEEVRTLSPAEFPPLLAEIPDTPKTLYLRGALPDWNNYKILAVVGSRKYTDYGKEAVTKIIRELAGYPVMIVSGLALGIDSIAHQAALEAGLLTIAVPGSGLSDRAIYPAQHLGLAKRIVDSGGALLSEYAPDFHATLWSFPQRNRIMAGMSHATLVIEAEKKSGTLITSRLATEYNRDVLTVPGPIFSKTSEGPHMLIRLGATPVSSGADVLEALHIEEAVADEKTPLSDCSPKELSILELLTEPLPRDTLIQKSALEAPELNMILSLLEIKGLVNERMGKIGRT